MKSITLNSFCLLLMMTGTAAAQVIPELIRLDHKLYPQAEGVAGFEDAFSKSIALQAGTAMIGSQNAGESGAVLVFAAENNSWVETDVLRPIAGDRNTDFGAEIELAGEWAFISSKQQISDANKGNVYVYQRVQNQWQHHSIIHAETNDVIFGFGSAIAADGNHLVIAATKREPENFNTGIVFTFSLETDTWVQTQALQFNPINGLDRFGTDLDLHGDQLIIGDVINRAAVVFTFAAQQWQQLQVITGPGNDSITSFGGAVAIQGDNILIGSPEENDGASDTGAVRAYMLDTQTGQYFYRHKLIPNDLIESDNFGANLAISGNHAVVARQNIANFREEAAFVFELIDNSWVNPQKLTAQDNDFDFFDFGFDVDIDAGQVLTSASFSQPSGAAYVFTKTAGNWVETSKLVPSQGAFGNHFGGAISMNANWALVASTGSLIYSIPGDASFYRFNNGQWLTDTQLSLTEGQVASVALTDNHAFVASPGFFDVGSVQIMNRTSNSWELSTEIIPEGDFGSAIDFGRSMAAFNDILLVGAPNDDSNGFQSGSAFIFAFENEQWVQKQQLSPGDSGSSDNFGFTTELLNDQLMVGSPRHQINGVRTGSVYVFDKIENDWLAGQKIYPNDLPENARFGQYMDSNDDFLVVSAPLDDSGGNQIGSVFVYTNNAGTWVESQKLTQEVVPGLGKFGTALKLQNDLLFIGSSTTEEGPNNKTVKVYQLNQGNWQYARSIEPEGELFGTSDFAKPIASNAEYMFVGVASDDTFGTDSGAVFTYRLLEDVIYRAGFDLPSAN